MCEEKKAIYSRYTPFLFNKPKIYHLCPSCFNDFIENEVFSTLDEYSMIDENDRVGLAISGEKDSIVLFHLLMKYKAMKKKKFDLELIFVDEGMQGHREKCYSLLKKLSKSFNINLNIYKFEEVYNCSMDDLMKMNTQFTSCDFCINLRRNIIERASIELKINKICFGFNLTDVGIYSITTLMDGDIKKSDFIDKKVEHPNGNNIFYIKPLSNLKNIECAIYAQINSLEYVLDECPYYKEGIRDDIRDIINELEMRHPGSLELMTKGFYNIAKKLRENIKVNTCNSCGINFISNDVTKLCTSCHILDSIKKNQKF